ncbi:sugar phosphate isomerase/epimerase family protein [Aneurinibacillus terranovensis]|uniref:sugar phosphate isomerase/epimerase family protein n=1 Tax=Aneurinibacillus terranovensis TaxID=278991 RepID=UPI0004164575|nr:sugar phosphate isomerase/epimerase [Aneurinibacillus terranovensis]
MTRQFSLAHLTMLGCAPPEMTYIAAQAGYDFVSFRPIGLGTLNEPQYPLAEDKVMLRETKAALAETGLKLLDIEMVRIYDGVDPKIYLPALEVAAELGARHVLTTGLSNDRHFVIDCFSELCDLAKPLGLTIDLEFITWYNVSTFKEALDIVRAANRENAGIIIDTLHFNRSRVRLEELDEVPPEWFHFAHVCDAPKEIPATKEGLIHTAREERLYLGEGGIEVAAILNRMPVIPYSLEIPHAKRTQELGYEEFARRCLQTAKDYLNTYARV